MLNGFPRYLRSVLEQGFWPESHLAAPSAEAIRREVELIQELGFNAARIHQKVEDPRFLSWCDRLGLMVWGEMANTFTWSDAAVTRVTREWTDAVLRDRNSPAIVAWVPINESWGVPALQTDPRQPNWQESLWHLTHALDGSRPVISNDGWEHAYSDLCTIHDYSSDAETLYARYAAMEEVLAYRPSNRPLYVGDFRYEGQPILVSECGGIAFRLGDEQGWGYSTVTDEEAFAASYGRLVGALQRAPLLQGYCYTQLTDVEQEINGLLTYDRRPKLPLEIIRAINQGRSPEPEAQAERLPALAPA